VQAVMQAINKLEEPHFDPQDDARVLQLLGRVSMEVLKVCEASGAATVMTKRKDSLLNLFTRNLPVETPVGLIHTLEQGFQELFMSKAVALHLVYAHHGLPVERHHTVRIMMDRAMTKVTRQASDTLTGLVGQSVKNMTNSSFSATQLEGTPFDKDIDLPVAEKMAVHTFPIVHKSEIVAVCQFVCPEKDKAMIADDGSYQPGNNAHQKLLTHLFNLVQRHLHLTDPRNHAGSNRGSSEAEAEQ